MPDFFHAPLDQFTVFSATGEDAVAFLQGQLTQDMLALDDKNARYAGYCTPKGRLLGTLVVWRDSSGGLSGFVRADIAESLVKRLRMFVLRAKVKFDFSAWTVSGVCAPASQADVVSALAGISAPAEPWSRVDGAAQTWIAAPSADPGVRRWWVCHPAGQALAVAQDARFTCVSADTWIAQDVAAGLPWIGASTQDLFIPQTVNLDLINGVSFTKGCYPGQEIVARSHYRGTVKRRMSRGVLDGTSVDSGALAGTDIYDADKPDEPCGRVISAARAGDLSILFETTLAELEHDQLRLGAVNGPRIKVTDLPYSF